MWTIRNGAIKWKNFWNYSSADMTDTTLNVKTAVIRHHQSCHQMWTLLSPDTTVRISNCTNKNVSLVSGINYDILIFQTSACMTSDEWNHIWSASTQTVWTKENLKK